VFLATQLSNMVSRLSSIAVWAVALCFLCFAVLSNASDTPHHPHAKRDDKLRRRSVVSKLALKHHDFSHRVVDILTIMNSQGT
jgi:hypothetical protein